MCNLVDIIHKLEFDRLLILREVKLGIIPKMNPIPPLSVLLLVPDNFAILGCILEHNPLGTQTSRGMIMQPTAGVSCDHISFNY
jgi:hypothetical protein